MSWSNLIRRSGVAAVVAGSLFVVSDLSDLASRPDARSEVPGSVEEANPGVLLVQSGLTLLAGVFLLFGLLGLYANRFEEMGLLGLFGFVTAFSGTNMADRGLFGERFRGAFPGSRPDHPDSEPLGGRPTEGLVGKIYAVVRAHHRGMASFRAGGPAVPDLSCLPHRPAGGRSRCHVAPVPPHGGALRGRRRMARLRSPFRLSIGPGRTDDGKHAPLRYD